MNLKTLNHPKIQPITAQLMALVNCTEREYLMHLLNTGAAKCEQLYPDAYYYKIMISSDAYWLWYINQFTIIDKAIFDIGQVPDEPEYLFVKGYDGIVKMDIYTFWLNSHKPSKIKANPNSQTIEEAENEYIKNSVVSASLNQLKRRSKV